MLRASACSRYCLMMTGGMRHFCTTLILMLPRKQHMFGHQLLSPLLQMPYHVTPSRKPLRNSSNMQSAYGRRQLLFLALLVWMAIRRAPTMSVSNLQAP